MKKETIVAIFKELFKSYSFNWGFYGNDFSDCFGQYDDQCFLGSYSEYLHCRICKIIVEEEE